MEKKKKKHEINTRLINLVEQTIIKDSDPLFPILDNLCFLSKNIYNCVLYEMRQAFFNKEKIPTYNEIDKKFRNAKQSDYLALPQKVSQQTEKLAVSAMTSFYGGCKSQKNKENGTIVQLPRYLNKEKGRQTVFYTNQAVSTTKLKSQGFYTLSGVKDSSGKLIQFKTSVTNIQFVRISHHGNHIAIEVGYRERYKFPKVTENIASIDLGVDNIVTMTTNFDSPIIINGKPIKYINHEYNEQISKNQSSNICCNGIKENKWTSKMYKIAFKRNYRIKDYFHKISRFIVNYLVSNHVSVLVIGKNNGWKQNTDMGKRNNQNFVQIPFNLLISMLEYKCMLNGIRVFTICESHTSKCSFIDKEKICHHETYVGKRLTRDLFYTKNNICINADVNGSYNIMKRWCIQNNNEHYLTFNKQYICKNPKVITLKLSGNKCDIGEYINKVV